MLYTKQVINQVNSPVFWLQNTFKSSYDGHIINTKLILEQEKILFLTDCFSCSNSSPGKNIRVLLSVLFKSFPFMNRYYGS